MRVLKPRSFIENCANQTGILLTRLPHHLFPAKAYLVDEIIREGYGDADECLHTVTYTLVDAKNKQLFSAVDHPLIHHDKDEDRNIAPNWLETIYLKILDLHPVLKVRCSFAQYGGKLVINDKRNE